MNQQNIEELEAEITRSHGNITGILAQKNGATLYESYFNGYAAQDPVHIFSVTKSVVSALIGVAIEKGYIPGVDCKVLDFFPDYRVPEGEKSKPHVTIRHLLTMTAPYHAVNEPFEEYFASENWMNFALDFLGGEGPIGNFQYSPIIGTQLLSGILVKATGCPVLDFATENLFSPLGIRIPGNVELRTKEEHIAVMSDRSTSGWVVDPQGINTASWGLFLTPIDMAKIGQLYQNNGIWNGRQIVPAQWVRESTSEHSRWGTLSYGYLWWVLDGERFAALGDGGNTIYVNRKTNTVITIAALFSPDAGDSIELIQTQIEPLLEDRT